MLEGVFDVSVSSHSCWDLRGLCIVRHTSCVPVLDSYDNGHNS
ncbi:MAG: hypothetical protein OXC44_02305 [Proteobacteria bacterium]|nr:hypothetical protein [Pseudomonadota bacterium]